MNDQWPSANDLDLHESHCASKKAFTYHHLASGSIVVTKQEANSMVCITRVGQVAKKPESPIAVQTQ